MKETTFQDYRERMLRVLLYIQENLDGDLSLDVLARVACFSPFHFHRIFRGMTGESLMEHVRRLRLERAALRLKRTVHPVTEIALEAGYETHEAFTRAFRAMTGLAPSRFRREKGTALFHVPAEARLRGTGPREEGGKKMDVKIVLLEPLRVAFVRHTGPYDQCGGAWDTLCTFLGKEGYLGPGAWFIGLCHDDPEVTPPERVRYDACVTADEGFRPQGEIGVRVIPGGEYAMTTHFGPYEKLGDTYARLFGEWLPRSGRALRDAPCLERYLNDPNGTDPEDLVTDLYAPLEPLRGR